MKIKEFPTLANTNDITFGETDVQINQIWKKKQINKTKTVDISKTIRKYDQTGISE